MNDIYKTNLINVLTSLVSIRPKPNNLIIAYIVIIVKHNRYTLHLFKTVMVKNLRFRGCKFLTPVLILLKII